jgi:predicted dehydrogenase
MKTWKIAGINFDHMHMGDLLRQASEHPKVEIVGISDEQPERMEMSIRNFNIPRNRVFTDYRECLEKTKPDLVILCPACGQSAWRNTVRTSWSKSLLPHHSPRRMK